MKKDSINHKKRIHPMKIFYGILLTSLILTLNGCSLLSPVKNDQTNYLLTQTSSYHPTKWTQAVSLLVMKPEARAFYQTNDMAYTIKPYQIAYFSQNRWAETPSQMLHPLIVESLENTHYFHAIITPPFTGHYDYILNTQVLMLQQDFLQHPPLLKLIVRAQLTNASTNRVIATQQFIVYEPMKARTPYAGVIAANRATAKFLSLLSQFCINHVGGRSPVLGGEG